MKLEARTLQERMSIFSPLILIPYLDRAKAQMVKTLIDCSKVPSDVATIISSYIFMDINTIYSKYKTKNESPDAKSLTLLNRLTHFTMDTNVNIFDEYRDEKLLKYFVHSIEGGYIQKLLQAVNGKCNEDEFVLSFIKVYNETCDDKFPMNEDVYGIYYIIAYLYDKYRFRDEFEESTMLFFKYIKDCYAEEFDINHKYNYEYESEDITLVSYLTKSISFIKTKNSF